MLTYEIQFSTNFETIAGQILNMESKKALRHFENMFTRKLGYKKGLWNQIRLFCQNHTPTKTSKMIFGCYGDDAERFQNDTGWQFNKSNEKEKIIAKKTLNFDIDFDFLTGLHWIVFWS